MKKVVLHPLLWTLGGALATLWLTGRPLPELPEPTAHAQVGTAVARMERLPSGPSVALTPEEQANIRVYEVASRSVVNIDTRTARIDPFFRMAIPGQGSGSGSVLDKEGHILTNFHVVEGARQIEVTLASGKAYSAEVVGHDAEHDMAVLKIDAPAGELFPLELGRSDSVRVGQQAYALGNPFGLEGSLTKGIVSSLNRSIEGRTGREMKSLIQTDAAMNPGNSGGPLLDSNARMIGMNVAIATKTGQNAGIGFAIPVNRVRTIVPQLIEHGKVIRPDHGIVAVMDTDNGVVVAKVRPNGPADQAGLRGIRIVRERRKQGNIIYEQTRRDFDYADLVVAVNDQPIRTHSELLDLMDSYQPGDQVTLTVLRDGQRQQLPMTLGEQ